MKNIVFIIAGVVFLFALGFGYDMYGGPQFVPVPVSEQVAVNDVSLGSIPDFKFKTMDGEEISIDALKGKPVIVNFWATWCPTCLVELPDMLNMIKHYDGDVILLAVSSDNARKDIERFIAKQSGKMKAIFNSAAVYITWDKNRIITHDLFLTERYPETIIVDPNGEMVRKIVGEFDWDSDEIKAYLDTLR